MNQSVYMEATDARHCKLTGVDWRVPCRSRCKIPCLSHPVNPDKSHTGPVRVCWLGWVK